jgi:hypothetical protein
MGPRDRQSIEIFAPIYDLICEMMAQHGLAFARRELILRRATLRIDSPQR